MSVWVIDYTAFTDGKPYHETTKGFRTKASAERFARRMMKRTRNTPGYRWTRYKVRRARHGEFVMGIGTVR